jgi:hypothetical protein
MGIAGFFSNPTGSRLPAILGGFLPMRLLRRLRQLAGIKAAT